jgi:hypothetical protein
MLAVVFGVHALAAVAAFVWLTMRIIAESPFANLVGGLALGLWATIPYAIFAWASVVAARLISASVVLVSCVACGGFAFFAYAGAFQLTDGEYMFVFFLVAGIQALIAAASLGIAYLSRRHAEAL